MKKSILKFQTKAEFDAFIETTEDFDFTAYIVETGEMKYGDFQSPYVTESSLEDFSREISVDTINAFNLSQMKDLYYYPVAHPDYNINGDANILPQRYKGYQVFEKTYDIFVDGIQEIDDKLVIELNGVDIEKILSVDGIFTFNGEPNYTKLFDPSKMEIKEGKIYHDIFWPSTTHLKKVSIIIKYYGEAGYYSDYGKEDDLPHHDTSKMDKNGKEYVDLGLPSGALWAKHIVGADTGDTYSYKAKYFAWGETSGYSTDASGDIVDGHNFDWSTYKWCSGTFATLNKYNTDPEYGDVDNKTVLEIEDDAVHSEMGGDWHMPQKDLLKELLKYTTRSVTEINYVKGIRLVSKINGNSLFIPFIGCRLGSTVRYVGDYVYLWSSSLYVSNPYYAVLLDALSDGYVYIGNSRYYGYGVLGVLY